MDRQVQRGLAYAAVIAMLVGAWVLAEQFARRDDAPEAPVAPPPAVAAGPAPDRLEGAAKVFDADTIEVQGIKLRLDGIDGPEYDQQCGSPGREWPCGKDAATALRKYLRTRPVVCRVDGVDRYARALGHCTVGPEDLQRWLVRNGWAVAYSRFSGDYFDDEREAEAASAGLWRDVFIRPERWRRETRPDQ